MKVISRIKICAPNRWLINWSLQPSSNLSKIAISWLFALPYVANKFVKILLNKRSSRVWKLHFRFATIFVEKFASLISASYIKNTSSGLVSAKLSCCVVRYRSNLSRFSSESSVAVNSMFGVVFLFHFNVLNTWSFCRAIEGSRLR